MMDCFSPLIADTAGLDAAAIREYGIPSLTLMERAGEALVACVHKVLTHKALMKCCAKLSQHRILVLCGPGNNGGDGFVLARLLCQQLPQSAVTVCVAQRRDPMDASSDAATNEARLKDLPIQWLENPSIEALNLVISQACLVVDALFGVGLSRVPRAPYKHWIEAVNVCNTPVLSVDIPSGIDAITGNALGAFVQATCTVTFGTAKPGHWLGQGKQVCGQLTVADIGFPSELLATYPTPYQLLTEAFAMAHWPWPKSTDYKVTRGHCWVIAGSEAMPGAAQLATEACLAGGAGLTTLITDETVWPQVIIPPDCLRQQLRWAEVTAGTWSKAAKQRSVQAIVVGPGLGSAAHIVLTSLLEWHKGLNTQKPLLILDADALNALASDTTLSSMIPDGTILTPHPGEAARLLAGIAGWESSQSVIDDAYGAAKAIQARWGGHLTVVIKTATPIVVLPNCIGETQGHCWISCVGNAALARAGSGDVLAGLMGSLAAQLATRVEHYAERSAIAARLAVWWHGATAEHLSEERTLVGVPASTLITGLHAALKKAMEIS
ncbi:MAG: NAD(P)H-hydrate epimerase [Vampirovibrionales bacterium]|nr:NAD(P)H-hydrate epimerase [Vampirovibrionales bacterium]